MANNIYATQWVRDEWLTDYAIGLASQIDQKKRFGTFMCPIVPVTNAHGKYSEWVIGDTLQATETRRALNSESNTVNSTKIKRNYDCGPRGLNFKIDDSIRTNMSEQELREDKQSYIDDLIIKALISIDLEVKQMIDASVTPTTQITNLANGNAINNIGNWSNGAIDPTEQLKALALYIKARTTKYPIRWAISAAGWHILAANQALRNRIRYNSIDELTPELLIRGCNLQDKMSPDDILIVDDTYNQSLPGGDFDPKFMINDDFYIFYAQDTPDRHDQSFAKCFNTGGTDFVSQVQVIQDPKNHTEITEINWEDDFKVTSPASGMRIKIS